MKDGVYRSVINDISLPDFIIVRMLHCKNNHNPNCKECTQLVACAKDILEGGIVEVKPLFQRHFAEATYSSQKVVRRFMQLPVAILMLQLTGPGSQKLYVTQLERSVDYYLFSDLMTRLKDGDSNKQHLSKDTLREICSLASTEKDRKLIKFAACQASGLSNKRASQQYGVYNFSGIRN